MSYLKFHKDGSFPCPSCRKRVSKIDPIGEWRMKAACWCGMKFNFSRRTYEERFRRIESCYL